MELGGDYNINVGELVEASNSIFDYLASFLPNILTAAEALSKSYLHH